MPELNQTAIARLANVSQATVSRVLNDDPQVNEDLRKRVLAVIETHEYAPDSRAQSLRSKKGTKTLGLVMYRSPSRLAYNPFFSALMAGILEYGGKRGYHLCVDAARNVHSRRVIYEELLRTKRVDGLILVESEAQDERIARLNEEGFPFVLIGRYDPVEAVYSVDNDNVGAAEIAATYLLEQGHRRIAYIGGPKDVVVTQDRLCGYRNALDAQDLRPDPNLIHYGDFSEGSGYRAMLKLLELPKPPTAVLALDDVMAIGAMRAAKGAGRRVPDDIAFIGFNDSPFCAYVDPPLTSIAVDVKMLSQIATEMLIDLIESRPVLLKRRIVPCQLVPRESA